LARNKPVLGLVFFRLEFIRIILLSFKKMC